MTDTTNALYAELLLPQSDRKERHRAPVVRELVERIVSGHYPLNSTLPTEAQLVEEFGVSRTVIREVVHELTAMGLLSVRPRVGAVINVEDEWDRLHPHVLSAFLANGLKASFYEPLMEARALIEPEFAAMAAARATPMQVARIKITCERLERAVEEDKATLIACDLAFHKAVLGAAGNWVLDRFAPIIEAAIVARASLMDKKDTDERFDIEKHRAVLNAIEARNPREARRLILNIIALSKPQYFEETES